MLTWHRQGLWEFPPPTLHIRFVIHLILVIRLIAIGQKYSMSFVVICPANDPAKLA